MSKQDYDKQTNENRKRIELSKKLATLQNFSTANVLGKL